MFESFNGKYYPVSIYADVIEPALASVHSADLDGRKFILRFLNDLDPRAKNARSRGESIKLQQAEKDCCARVNNSEGLGGDELSRESSGIDGFYDEDEILSLHPFNELIQNGWRWTLALGLISGK